MAFAKGYFQNDDDVVGGYDFELVNENKDLKLECSICLLLVREAMGTPCSHVFCKACLQKLLNKVNIRNIKFRCPDCKQLVNEVLPNAFANRLVTGSDVFCKHREAGCPWKGSLASYFENHDRECEYKMVHCQNEGCVFSCERRNLQEHVLDCKFRIVECEHCTVESKIIELDRHYSSCVRFPTVCPHDECGSIVPKNEMKEHLNIQCPFVIIDCMYATFGCTEKVKRRDTEKHNQSSMNNHMNLMFNEIVQSKNEIDKLRQENTKYRNEIDGLQQMCTKSQIEINNTRKENTKLGNEIDKRITETENRVDEQKKEIEKQKKEIEKFIEPLQIEEILSKGTEKWIRKKDVQCFGLAYQNWYAKVFLLMKELMLYKLDSVMCVKIKNEERRKRVYWFSNNSKGQNDHASSNDVFFHENGLVLRQSVGFLVVSTATLNDCNHQNKSAPFVIHPQYQEKMIRMQNSHSGNDWNKWFTDDIPEDFYINDFLIFCLAKFA